VPAYPIKNSNPTQFARFDIGAAALGVTQILAIRNVTEVGCSTIFLVVCLALRKEISSLKKSSPTKRAGLSRPLAEDFKF
jgi:hypothetical protein